jgi:alanyl-tRNA synthetase
MEDLSKDKLRQEFSKEPEKYYSTKLFRKEGFKRKQCPSCGKYFWTIDDKRMFCGDSSHEPYSFFREHPREISYVDFWKTVSDFFRKNGHEIIDKYPVVSRWRQDLYFTIASIQDFQRIENGKMSFEYSANPLIVPQMCMRFTDIPNVGVTGRHLSCFMMLGQHAFNYPREGYWRDTTIELNFRLMTEVLGVERNAITYIEDVWAMGDFSEFGPCLEVFFNGLEAGNNVFTEFELSNGKITELKGKVVDVGLGFDRMLWYYCGTQTAYEAVFRKELDFIYRSTGIKPDHSLYAKIAALSGTIDMSEVKHGSDEEKKLIQQAGVSEHDYYKTIKPMQAAYAIADHTRSLLFAITDGALPSNVGGGYNLRILLRRVFDFMEMHHMKLDLSKLIEIEAKNLVGIYPNIESSLDEIGRVIEIEKERYAASKKAASAIINAIIERKEKLTVERLRVLYESNGITPEFISTAAEQKGVKLEVPEEAYNTIIKGDFVEKSREEKKRDKEMALKLDISGLPKTELLFYKLAEGSTSTVLASDADEVVLDKTPFYAESGGQEADFGTISGIQISAVRNIGGVVVHTLSKKHKFDKGAAVRCEVDMGRRIRLMAHHTATHLISAAARAVLGKHAWQEGAHKSPNKAHIDIAHYEKFTEEAVKKIENTANMYILNGIKVKMEVMERNEAEGKFGFSIYQGHGVPAKELRIVSVSDLHGNIIDAEACGGLHLMGRETSIGLIKIISSQRIHDGINRLEFVAGPAAMEYINSIESDIRSIAAGAGVDKDKVKEGIAQQLKDLEYFRKERKKMIAKISDITANELLKQGTKITAQLDYDRMALRSIATAVIEKDSRAVAMLYNDKMEMLCIAGEKSGVDASEFLKLQAEKLGKGKFIGGGSKKMAEGIIS